MISLILAAAVTMTAPIPPECLHDGKWNCYGTTMQAADLTNYSLATRLIAIYDRDPVKFCEFAEIAAAFRGGWSHPDTVTVTDTVKTVKCIDGKPADTGARNSP